MKLFNLLFRNWRNREQEKTVFGLNALAVLFHKLSETDQNKVLAKSRNSSEKDESITPS